MAAGLLGVKEITVLSTQPGQTRDPWKTALAPVTVGSGPSVLITDGEMDVIARLVPEVESLQVAQDFLALNGLLGETGDGEVGIDPDKVQGLDMTLVEASAR